MCINAETSNKNILIMQLNVHYLIVNQDLPKPLAQNQDYI